MRDKEIVGLYQAYLDVYSNSNEEVEQLDERSLVTSELENEVKHRRMQNLNKAEAEEMRARDAGATMGELSTLSANTSKAADRVSRNRRLLSGRAKRMNKEEVENWVNSLIEEGYDLSDYTWEEMYETYANLNEGRTTSLSALSRESQKSKDDKKRGRPETKSETDSRLAMGNFRPGASQEERAEGGRQVLKDRGKVPKKGGKDMFEHILEYLVAEGYADTEQAAESIMVNMSEEWREDIMEISQKTATRAYAISATGEFEGADDESDIKRTENLGKHIERKFGKKALEDADRHADSSTFGRTDPRTGKRQPRPQSRFQNPNKYRTTKDGKMHGQDQNKLKAKLQKRRPSDSDN